MQTHNTAVVFSKLITRIKQSVEKLRQAVFFALFLFLKRGFLYKNPNKFFI